jgi:hypothetical protein
MIVTLDAYSGRPNPSWRLSAKDASSLLERVAGKMLAADSESQSTGVLGPRGFVIDASSDDELPTSVPVTFRVGSPQAVGLQSEVAGASVFSVSEGQEISRFLLYTGRHVVEEDLTDYVEKFAAKSIQAEIDATQLPWTEPAEPAPEEPAEPMQVALPETAAAAAACIIANTAYNPGFWNTAAVQPKNNCYNYAMNWRSDTFAQPGRISGHMWTAINCSNVGTAANWDGCKTTCSGSNKNVALVIAPGPGFVDYHWYRRHSGGFWGHKPGGTAARNTDNRGRVINGTTLTPANCDRGPYTIFCGYRFSPTGMRVR